MKYHLLLLGAVIPLGCSTALAVRPEPRSTPWPPAQPGAPLPPAKALVVGDYSPSAWSEWRNLTYWPWSPKVSYLREQGPDGNPVVKASSDNAGSMWVRAIRFDLAAAPIVHWHWKISAPVAGANERIKAKDDCAARIYFVWNLERKEDLFRAEAIAYIWGNARQVGEVGPSPYSEKVGIVTLRSGSQGAGEWQEETRDLMADYRTFFHRAPPGPVTAIALLTDTDNTHTRTVSWYGQVYALPRSAAYLW